MGEDESSKHEDVADDFAKFESVDKERHCDEDTNEEDSDSREFDSAGDIFENDETEAWLNEVTQLSESVFIYQNKKISDHGNVFEGESRSGVYGVRVCAIKFARKSKQNVREARILAKLGSHTHVISIIQSGIYKDMLDERVYIALDKCNDQNLHQHIALQKESGVEFNSTEALEYSKQIISGTTFVHENLIIHKDLKPSNILLSHDKSTIKLADFGLSQEIKSTLSKAYIKHQFGTNGFRPVESFGNNWVSLKSDTFSLGATLFFVLSNGRSPFGDETSLWTYNIQNGVIDLSHLLVPNATMFGNLIKSMLSKERCRRPSIWQVADHPCWTGKDLERHIDYSFTEEINDSDVKIPEEGDQNSSDSESEMESRQLLTTLQKMGYNVTKDKVQEIVAERVDDYGFTEEINDSDVKIPEEGDQNSSDSESEMESRQLLTALQKMGYNVTKGKVQEIATERVDGNLSQMHILKGRIHVCYEICLSNKDPPIYYGFLKDELTVGKEVAVKKLLYNPNKRDQVDREIKARLSIKDCPYIVEYMDHYLSSQSDDLFIAMELCRTSSLADFNFNQNEALPFEELRNVLVHLASGIEKIHRTGVIHGALKLTNILQSKDGKFIKIGGFGLCKPAGEKTIRITADFGKWGSPEHYNSEMSRTKKSDIFSAGMIFHYVLSKGQHPFMHGDRNPIRNIKMGMYKLRLENLSYRKVAEDLIERMLQLAKEDRPSATDVLRHPLLWEQSRKDSCITMVKECWKDLDLDLKKKLHGIISRNEDENIDQELGDEDCLLLCIFLFQKFPDCEKEFENWKEKVLELQSNVRTFNEVSKCSMLQLIDFTDSDFDAALKELTKDMKEMTVVNNSTVDHKLKLLEQPIREGKLVFEGEFDGVVAEPVVVKLVEQTDENEMAIKVFRDCSEKIDAVIEIKRSIRGFIYPGSSLSRPTKKMFCIAMEPCETTLLLEQISQNDVPTSERINLAVHIVSTVLGIHRIGAIHGNIRPGKFLLAKNASQVKMLGSRKMKYSANLQDRSEDLRATAKVLCKLLNKNIEDFNYKNLEEFENLEEASETSICGDKRLFIDLLKRLWNENGETENLLIHPFFWGPDKKLDFWIDIYKLFEAGGLKQLKEVPHPENWFETLKLTDDERTKWFENDKFGSAYDKATKEKAKYNKDSTDSLIKFIRNFGTHPHDITNKHKKKAKLQGEQSLFCDKKSVGKFLYDRFSDFFYDVYNLVLESNKNETLLANYFQEITQKNDLQLGIRHPSTD